MDNMDKVNVAFAITEKYIPMLGVVLHSLEKNSDRKREYVIYVLHESIREEKLQSLKDVISDNMEMIFVDVYNALCGINLEEIAHYSRATYYRLLLEDVIPENVQKLLYLDSDIIILRDVAQLYDLNIEGYILGASRGRIFSWSKKYIEDNLCMKVDDYFNAGILLINMKNYRANKIGKRGLYLLSQNSYRMPDQDVLNLLCHQHGDHGCFFIDGRWNVEWEHLIYHWQELYLDEWRAESLKYVDDPFIIHYTSAIKPWNHPEKPLSHYYWEYACETMYYDMLLSNCALNLMTERDEEYIDLFHHFRFPWPLIAPGETFSIYGAGVVGRIFCEQMYISGYAAVSRAYDMGYVNIENFPVEVHPVDDIKKINGEERILIAIESEKVANEVRKDLIGIGVPEDKILWCQYVHESAKI